MHCDSCRCLWGTILFLRGNTNRNQERRDSQLLTTFAWLQTFHAHTTFQVSVLENASAEGTGLSIRKTNEKHSPHIRVVSHRRHTAFLQPLIHIDNSSAKGAMPHAATQSQHPAPSQSQQSQQLQQAHGEKPGKSRRTRRKMKRPNLGMRTRT